VTLDREVEVKKRIYGSILASESMNAELKRWREFFKVTQSELSREMGISPSVISDYEKGRQRHPGTRFLKNYVESLLRIDGRRGGTTSKLLSTREEPRRDDAILDIQEYNSPIPVHDVVEATESEVLVNHDLLDVPLFGHTVLDSMVAILSLSGDAFYGVYGSSTERALIFTKVSMGRSPMVAIRVYPLKPRMVILHGPSKVDKLAERIAEKERVILALSRIPTIDQLLENLSHLRSLPEKD
jgi:putative transcriptional regulator